MNAQQYICEIEGGGQCLRQGLRIITAWLHWVGGEKKPRQAFRRYLVGVSRAPLSQSSHYKIIAKSSVGEKDILLNFIRPWQYSKFAKLR